jgi:hypothetical protein
MFQTSYGSAIAVPAAMIRCGWAAQQVRRPIMVKAGPVDLTHRNGNFPKWTVWKRFLPPI